VSGHFLRDFVRNPDAAWTIRNVSTDAVVASTVLPAFDRQRRNRGLVGQQALEPGSALILAPCSAVHTWFMRFPIDIVFVARGGRVLKVKRSVGPWRLAARLGAFAVIELGAGASTGIDAGHEIALAS
jgi:uncharacterized membrane protein (UPF0127 family)